MIQHATGTFEVFMTPPDSPQERTVDTLGRMLLDKQFAGDLVASSQGQMLTAMTPTKGSAGYVAIELVTGTLGGRTGSFVLQHSGTMNQGAPLLLVTVVPDSGTEALAGISGQLTIRIAEGKHFYTLDYTLPA
jgi:Protein of unknown function (DUF3224)